MALLWQIGVSFVIVWIAEGLHVADRFPICGSTGLLITLILLALIGSYRSLDKDDIKKAIRDELRFAKRL